MYEILDYIHKNLFGRNIEANHIWRVSQYEVNHVKGEITQIFKNTRASLSDLEGIIRWEHTYDILPNTHIESLEERRDRVLEFKRTRDPYTESWMNDSIKRLYPEGSVVVILSNLTLNVFVDARVAGLNQYGYIDRRFRELMPWFRRWIPANILIIVTAIASYEFDPITVSIIPAVPIRSIERRLGVAMPNFRLNLNVWTAGVRSITRRLSMADERIIFDGSHIFNGAINFNQI